jgi:hypothetical protein
MPQLADAIVNGKGGQFGRFLPLRHGRSTLELAVHVVGLFCSISLLPFSCYEFAMTLPCSRAPHRALP